VTVKTSDFSSSWPATCRINLKRSTVLLSFAAVALSRLFFWLLLLFLLFLLLLSVSRLLLVLYVFFL
jgi:hypothetical protein